ncbi:YitT family protein [Roseomonas elaeocarpi]|uniref:YitT family protein n=1 Tax=Roseomonas elaeocarpi TaxID=907779 RepID=A0ABV6JMQ1_9PROT
MPQPSNPIRHRPYEDSLAILLGTLLVALGLAFYNQAKLVTGSMAGLALLIQYATGLSFGPVFAAINLPFCVFAWRHMGWSRLARTLVALALLWGFTWMTARVVHFDHLDRVYAAVTGGVLMGVGLLVLFRHQTGLGGTNILAMHLQDRHGFRAGYVLLSIDAAILLGACFILPVGQVALSMVGVAVLNVIIALNHRPGRYLGTA